MTHLYISTPHYMIMIINTYVINTHTHTHTHMYIYIYICIQRSVLVEPPTVEMLTLICDGCDGDFIYADLYPLGDYEVPEGDWYCPNCEIAGNSKVTKKKKSGSGPKIKNDASNSNDDDDDDDNTSNGKKANGGRSRKRERDPDAPKRPRSAYVLFMQEIQRDVRAANPDTPPTAIMTIIASLWQDLNEAAKQVTIYTSLIFLTI